MGTSRQPQTTKSGSQASGGEPLSLADDWDYTLRRPELKGLRYGLAKITTSLVRVRIGKHLTRGKYPQTRHYVRIRCMRCGARKWIMLGNLTRGISKGCRGCLQPKNAQRRCNDPENANYERYGGRGIEFRFEDVSVACIWVVQNLKVDRKREIDRIDNDGHYEPGNIRFSTRRQNCVHTSRTPLTPRLHHFRFRFTKVRYSDATLLSYFRRLKLTDVEIVRRWNARVRGVGAVRKGRLSGTSSTPDRFIASRYKAS